MWTQWKSVRITTTLKKLKEVRDEVSTAPESCEENLTPKKAITFKAKVESASKPPVLKPF